jgi:predicted nucleotidyltransferase
VFGSVARDNSPESDVNLLADFDGTKHYPLLTVEGLKTALPICSETSVDLSSPEWLKESVKNRVLRESLPFRDADGARPVDAYLELRNAKE